MVKDGFTENNNYKQKRRNDLLELGFSNAWIDKVTLQKPSLYENPRAKIEGLKSRGFTNPEKLITTFPTILGLSFDNIDAKIEGLRSRGFTNPEKLITYSERQPRASAADV